MVYTKKKDTVRNYSTAKNLKYSYLEVDYFIEMSYLRLITLFIIFCIISLPFGCVEENGFSSNTSVAIHLYDCNGFPGAFNNSLVSQGRYPLIVPDWTGTIHLKINSFPFTFAVNNDSDRFDYSYITVYDGVRRNDINVMPLEQLETNTYNWVYVDVIYPKFGDDRGYLRFISKDLCEQWLIDWLDSTGHTRLYVNLPGNRTSISGKIIFLKSYYIEGYYDFSNFGMKDVTLSVNSSPEIIFTYDDVNFYPGTNYINVVKNLPASNYGDEIDVNLKFDGYNSSSELNLYNASYRENSYFYPVPARLPINFQYKFISTVYLGVKATQEKWVSEFSCPYIFIDNSKQTWLYSPADKASNITGPTIFNYGSDTTGGVFYLRFFGKSSIQSFITSKTGVTFSEIENDGLTFAPNTQYLWWVEQPIGFSSVDDYLSSPYLQNPNYTWKLCSEVRTFTTAH